MVVLALAIRLVLEAFEIDLEELLVFVGLQFGSRCLEGVALNC